MRLVVISDTHFGDPMGTLIVENNGSYKPGEKFEQFSKAAGKNNDYLVLLGDIFDFSLLLK